MSRIYFHSPSGESELRGSERAYMGGMANDAMLWALRLNGGGFDWPEEVAAVASLLSKPGETAWTAQRLATHLAVSSGAALKIGEYTIDAFTLGLNTLIANGSDPAILAARLHGQCEIHCYIEGGNRAWLASVILRGRESAIFRADQGWEAVAEFLCSRSDEPVVTSYSVCEQFPNAGLVERAGLWTPPRTGDAEDDGPDWDAWYDIAGEEQWRLGMAAIRQDPWLELNPERWRWPDYHFGLPLTAHHAMEAAVRVRLAREKGDAQPAAAEQ